MCRRLYHDVRQLADAGGAAGAFHHIPLAYIRSPAEAPGLTKTQADLQVNHRQLITEQLRQLHGHPGPVQALDRDAALEVVRGAVHL
jgi:hypothetical protein